MKKSSLCFLVGTVLTTATLAAQSTDSTLTQVGYNDDVNSASHPYDNDTLTYQNPVIRKSVPDPTVLRAEDGYYYLYATESVTRNVPIYRSPDMVDWQLVGTVFTDENRPTFVESLPKSSARIWAPDINYVDGKYYLYYSMSRWGSEWECGIGVATADSPTGPFLNHGKMFISSDFGTQNSIDPFFIEDNGRKYLFWGSFRGIWGAELTDDGLAVRPETIRQIVGTLTEGTYILPKEGYYYLIGSAGSCCEGANSTYHLVMARSENLFGPYVDMSGEPALDNHFSPLLYRSDKVIGPGHNAEFMQDDAGQWWIIYHGFLADNEGEGRVGFLDRVFWSENGWPYILDMRPSESAPKPIIKQSAAIMP
ncbi:MAG: family 43 glycosylhydrolase [Muribaculaceae bacterium]|nr:family 43 glycosylhydrolase [Muribaculaceae bacterium]